jgi:hypothetical protein
MKAIVASVAVSVFVLAGAAWTVREIVSTPRVANCRVPPDEGDLMDAYEHDSMARPPAGVTRRVRVERDKACVEKGLDQPAGPTFVSVSYQLSRPYDEAALHGAYDPVAKAHGWQPAPEPPKPDWEPSPAFKTPKAEVRYRKRVDDVDSLVVVHASDGRPMSGIYLQVSFGPRCYGPPGMWDRLCIEQAPE